MSSHTQKPRRLTVPDIIGAKHHHQKLSMVTCYDSTFAKLLNSSPIDLLLVGDSLAMVMHGHADTIPATTDLMALHTAAVARGAPDKFIIADTPFLSMRRGVQEAVECADKLMKAGAQAIKIEGLDGQEEIISHLTQSGIPVMGHLGYTPQSTHAFGNKIVQGKSDPAIEKLIADAQKLADLGCFSLVLECVPVEAAKRVTESTPIPTIGIGAGIHCDGQVLVLQDMLGLNEGFKPKFLRHYADGASMVRQAMAQFDADVKGGQFPNANESYQNKAA